MKTKYERLYFDRCADKNSWFVWEIGSRVDLGLISYYPIASCYIFEGRNGCKLDTKLLTEIIDFMNQLDGRKK